MNLFSIRKVNFQDYIANGGYFTKYVTTSAKLFFEENPGTFDGWSVPRSNASINTMVNGTVNIDMGKDFGRQSFSITINVATQKFFNDIQNLYLNDQADQLYCLENHKSNNWILKWKDMKSKYIGTLPMEMVDPMYFDFPDGMDANTPEELWADLYEVTLEFFVLDYMAEIEEPGLSLSWVNMNVIDRLGPGPDNPNRITVSYKNLDSLEESRMDYPLSVSGTASMNLEYGSNYEISIASEFVSGSMAYIGTAQDTEAIAVDGIEALMLSGTGNNFENDLVIDVPNNHNWDEASESYYYPFSLTNGVNITGFPLHREDIVEIRYSGTNDLVFDPRVVSLDQEGMGFTLYLVPESAPVYVYAKVIRNTIEKTSGYVSIPAYGNNVPSAPTTTTTTTTTQETTTTTTTEAPTTTQDPTAPNISVDLSIPKVIMTRWANIPTDTYQDKPVSYRYFQNLTTYANMGTMSPSDATYGITPMEVVGPVTFRAIIETSNPLSSWEIATITTEQTTQEGDAIFNVQASHDNAGNITVSWNSVWSEEWAYEVLVSDNNSYVNYNQEHARTGTTHSVVVPVSTAYYTLTLNVTVRMKNISSAYNTTSFLYEANP